MIRGRTPCGRSGSPPRSVCRCWDRGTCAGLSPRCSARDLPPTEQLGTGPRPRGSLEPEVHPPRLERSSTMMRNRKPAPPTLSTRTLVRLRHEDEGAASLPELVAVIVVTGGLMAIVALGANFFRVASQISKKAHTAQQTAATSASMVQTAVRINNTANTLAATHGQAADDQPPAGTRSAAAGGYMAQAAAGLGTTSSGLPAGLQCRRPPAPRTQLAIRWTIRCSRSGRPLRSV